MIRIARVCGLASLALISWNLQAWAQRGRSAGMVSGGATVAQPHAPAQAPASNIRGANTQANGMSVPGDRGFFIPPLTGPLFPTALGNNVGLHAFPPVATPPGIGNINQPGLPPGAPTFYPNINNPAGPLIGVPASPVFRTPGSPSHQGGEHRRHGFGGPVAVPYYYGIPYYVYYGDTGYAEAPPAPDSATPPELAPEAPSPTSPNGPRLYYVPPQATGEQQYQLPAPPLPPVGTQHPSAGEQPQQPPSPAESQQAPATTPQPRSVTLLAFKDQTIVAVTDYWLKGDEIYYKRNTSSEVGIPLEQLDFWLTEQLNRERHVPFVLESRP
jgi:hypothetical protein